MKSPAKQLALIEKIREDIAAGRYRNDLCLPTEAEYSVLFHVSRQTVRKALNALEEQGVIRRVQGSGSYVNHPSQRRRKTGQIAVICTYISEYIFPSILRGIEQVTKENDYQLLMNSTNNSIASERAILSKLRDNPARRDHRGGNENRAAESEPGILSFAGRERSADRFHQQLLPGHCRR